MCQWRGYLPLVRTCVSESMCYLGTPRRKLRYSADSISRILSIQIDVLLYQMCFVLIYLILSITKEIELNHVVRYSQKHYIKIIVKLIWVFLAKLSIVKDKNKSMRYFANKQACFPQYYLGLTHSLLVRFCIASTVLNMFKFVGGVYGLKVIKTILGSSYSLIVYRSMSLNIQSYMGKILRRFAYDIWHMAYGLKKGSCIFCIHKICYF